MGESKKAAATLAETLSFLTELEKTTLSSSSSQADGSPGYSSLQTFWSVSGLTGRALSRVARAQFDANNAG